MHRTAPRHAHRADDVIALYVRGFVAPLIPAAVLSLAALLLL